MLRRMWLAYQAVGNAFGVWVGPIVTAFFFFWLRVYVAIGMALDNVFFPKLARTEIKAPIIIVGNPRTGTTFLQRFLVDNGLGSGMEVWRMLYPSLVLQTFLKPFLPTLEKFSPARHHSTDAHETSLTSVETEDPGVFFRYFDGFFLYGFLLAWHEKELKSEVDPALRDTAERDFGWLRAIWRRNLVATNTNRVVSKLFSLGPRLPRFLQSFPDAKILYMVRDPLEVIPSTMSLTTGVLDKRFGFWSLPEHMRRRYLDRLYGGLVELFQRFHADYTSGRIPRDKVLVVTFPRLMADFDGLMHEILEFVDVKANPELEATIRKVADKQRAYKSKHAYDLERFGLDEAKIRRDCAFVYDTFLSEPTVTRPAEVVS
jgi:omega-hydroxy-beta-dihydromenaquinone-9 sulfotransferase